MSPFMTIFIIHSCITTIHNLFELFAISPSIFSGAMHYGKHC